MLNEYKEKNTRKNTKKGQKMKKYNKPFLKWAGNKFKILDTILSVVPSGKRIIEPFAGSCAVSLNHVATTGIVSDINEDLINTYKSIQKHGKMFVEYCKTFFTNLNNNKDSYYEIREKFNNTDNIEYKSAAFIYLNRHCFNGLCRYNSQGKFNVPFGKYNSPYFPEKELYFFYKRSNFMKFEFCKFQDTFKNVLRGDIIYCDPPYMPISSTSFVDYAKNGFSIQQHIELVQCAEIAVSKGAIVIISNSLTDKTKELYKNAMKIIPIKVMRFIGADGNRKKASELIAIYK